MPGRAPRLGLTMRRQPAGAAGPDARDWLSADWSVFLGRALPGALWLPLPNALPDAVNLAHELGLDGVVFTGGDDLDPDSPRDKTETALLERCLRHGLPVAGVCRGLQFLNRALGGSLALCDEKTHVAARHRVECVGAGAPGFCGGVREVNSYHRWGVTLEGLAGGLEPLAMGPGGVVEALAGLGGRLVAVQWHPEREPRPDDEDVAWLRGLFTPQKEADRVSNG